MGRYWRRNWYAPKYSTIHPIEFIAILGHNIELMDKYFSISSFDAVYLIDLCEPLLQVARKRFAEKGWSNVSVLCQDASKFSLPEWSDGIDPKGTVGFVTLSYSLSMVSTSYF